MEGAVDVYHKPLLDEPVTLPEATGECVPAAVQVTAATSKSKCTLN
jgi:hypothetical protein